MSSDTNPCTYEGAFAPMLDKFKIAHNPVFHTTRPLILANFADQDFAEDFINSLK